MKTDEHEDCVNKKKTSGCKNSIETARIVLVYLTE